MLRTLFKGCVQDSVINVVRNLKFKAMREVESNIQHGKESLGKSIRAEVTGEKDVPEYINFSVPVFNSYAIAFHQQISVALEPNAAEELFRLIANPHHVEGVIHAGEEHLLSLIKDALGDSEIPVCFGEC